MSMKSPMKPTAYMKALGMDHKNHRGAWHAEPRKGTEEQAMDYANKDDTRAPGALRRCMFVKLSIDSDDDDAVIEQYWSLIYDHELM